MHRPSIALSLAVLSSGLAAQTWCAGNGIGSGYVSTTAAKIGGSLVMHAGSPASPNGVALLVFGNGAGPQFFECLDISGMFISLGALLDPTGDATFTFSVPAGTFGLGPIFAKGIALEGASTLSFSKTVRVSIEHPDSSRPLPVVPGPRSLHTCTAFESNPRDNRTGALVAGGATGSMIQPTALATTHVFDSLSRTWIAGPTMATARASHRAVRLANGRILLCGGMVNAGGTSTGGPATALCEIYDPVTNSLTPTGSMIYPRMGHAATLLPDGRVFVSGGFADWTDAGPNFAARLDTARAVTELWNPATGTWSAGPTMLGPRAGHSQLLMPDGRVLILSGIEGGEVHLISGFGNIEVPTFTAAVEYFAPATGQLALAQSIGLARGFFGASLLPNGQVLVTGGAASIGTYGEAAATNVCTVFDPAGGTPPLGQWTTNTPSLPTGVAFHAHVVEPSTGAAWLAGGYTGNFSSLLGSDQVVRHTGASMTPLATLGTNPAFPPAPFAVGAHAAAVLHDGTMLVTGGYAGDALAVFTTYDRALLLISP